MKRGTRLEMARAAAEKALPPGWALLPLEEVPPMEGFDTGHYEDMREGGWFAHAAGNGLRCQAFGFTESEAYRVLAARLKIGLAYLRKNRLESLGTVRNLRPLSAPD